MDINPEMKGLSKMNQIVALIGNRSASTAQRAESREQRGARAFDDVKRNGFMDRSAKKEGASEGRRCDGSCTPTL